MANWRNFANSQQEYEAKLREKARLEMRLRAHQDLISFFGLKKGCDNSLKMKDEQFNQMPDKYVRDLRDQIGCSLPPNFVDGAQKGSLSQEQLNQDPSLLASLLGGYNPPRICNIPPLDEQALEALHFPPNLKPKELLKHRALPPRPPQST